jgi:prepilin-type N-terminal cleavage/methylation domain-containing protein/prepilin-type processing-associated H-X9-DG protein
MTARPCRAFTLIEVLVVAAILGLLLAVLLPSLSRVRQRSKRTVCMSNLRQIGVAVQTCRSQNGDRFPLARSIPEPWVIAAIDDPPLYDALRRELPRSSRVYACPSDAGYVYDRCGISYLYNTNLSGRRPEDLIAHRLIGIPIGEIPVAWDFDGTTADIATGTVTIPFFHLRRNLLFADGHVGEFQSQSANPPSP